MKPCIHKEGLRPIIVDVVLCPALAVGANLLFPSQSVWHILLYAFLLFVIAMVVRFFRIPVRRKTLNLDHAVLAPADGEIVANEIVRETEYFGDERRQISIFMSIYNVHVNWFPMNGTVSYRKYHPGKFLVAFNPKSSTDNEHNSIVVKDAQGREVLVRQIAGFVARRIVSKVEAGDPAVAGEELGMIRFGSRVDVFLPVDAKIRVHIGDKTCGKRTVLASFY